MRPNAPRGARCSCWKCSQGLLPDGLVTGLAGLVELGEADHTVSVHQEGTPVGHASLVVKNPVVLRDLAMRPEVRQQWEIIALLVRPCLEGEHRVHRHGQHLHVGELRQVVAELVQLAGAGLAEGERVKHHQHVADTVEPRQRPLLVVLILQSEVRSPVSHLDRHVHSSPRLIRSPRRTVRADAEGIRNRVRAQRLDLAAFAVASLVAAQSSLTLMLDVCANPTVLAASLMSEGSTCPSRPVLGVNTQMTPLSANGDRASTRVSTRSPSSSRHHSSTTSTISSESSSSSSAPSTSSMAARTSSSTSASQPSSCTTMSDWIPSLWATPSLPASPAAAATTVSPLHNVEPSGYAGRLLLDGVPANTAVRPERNSQQRDTPVRACSEGLPGGSG